MQLKSRKGQTMVEYILIVVLIAISLLVLFGFFGKAIGKKVTGATSALDSSVGSEAKDEYDSLDKPQDHIKKLNEDGEF